MENKSVVDIWDEVAKGYTTSIDGAERDLADSIVDVLKKYGIEPGSKLLELGCGSGHLSACLNMAGYQTDMLDISPESLKVARRTFDEHGLSGRTILGDMMALGALDLSGYDLAWNSGVMEHFGDDLLIEVLRNIKKIARHTLVLVPNPHSVSYLLMRYVRQSEGDWPYGKEYLRTDYVEAMESAGFADVSAHYFGKAWTGHNFNVAMKEAESSAAFADMLKRDLLPEHEQYLIGYLASAKNVESEKEPKHEQTVTETSFSGNSEKITDVFELNAERFGVEKRLSEVSVLLEEAWAREKEYSKLQEQLNEASLSLEESWKREKIGSEQIAVAEAERLKVSSLLEESWGREKTYVGQINESEANRLQLQKKFDEVRLSLEASWEREKAYTKQISDMSLSLEESREYGKYIRQVVSEYSQDRNELRGELKTTKASLDFVSVSAHTALDVTNNLARSKFFMVMHLVRRIGKQLIKGSWAEKKRFFKWLSAHMSGRPYVDKGYNPLQRVTDILTEMCYSNCTEASATNIDADMRVLFVYKWATMGGCERVFLNRARAFKAHGISIAIDVYFFHDAGGLDNFRRYIEYFELGDYLRVVSHIDENAYDLIFTFDTPEIFDIVKEPAKVIVECHTPYKSMRKYLADLPENIAGVAAPSETFLENVVRVEAPEGFHDRLFVLPNFHIKSEDAVQSEWGWEKIPICYIGRMDSLKNSKALLEMFALISSQSDEYMLVLAGNVIADYMNLSEELKRLNIEENTHYLDAIPFEHVDALLESVRNKRGIFVSPSMGESFGLSALEAMSGGVPVILSDIDCHKALVSDDVDFLYTQGDVEQAVSKLMHISDHYDMFGERVSAYAARYDTDAFIRQWENFVHTHTT
ncbi:MAG: glycosyltransferase [Oscillospiraceae bacterium]|nr:glycosyltransferase [Oscillospiraceae bacterium]